MSGLAQITRSLPKRLAFGLGGFLIVVGLLVGAWFLWIALHPPPAGFAPTTGRAVAVAGQLPSVLQYTIDARSREDWAYFDLSRNTTMPTSQENLDWDLAFRRTRIITNGGAANSDGLGGAVDLGEIPLEQATPPVDGYMVDAIHEERGLVNPALQKWYNYNWTTHIVTSKSHTYALRTHTGEVILLAFMSYYCDDGSAGCITFRYAYPSGR